MAQLQRLIVGFLAILFTGYVVPLQWQEREPPIYREFCLAKPWGCEPERALDPLLERNGLSRSNIRFWVAHPGGRKVIDKIQQHFDLTASQLKFSSTVLRSYGNMSSPTVMFVLNEVIRNGNPRQGDWGVMIALGPGMAAEVALLQW